MEIKQSRDKENEQFLNHNIEEKNTVIHKNKVFGLLQNKMKLKQRVSVYVSHLVGDICRFS